MDRLDRFFFAKPHALRLLAWLKVGLVANLFIMVCTERETNFWRVFFSGAAAQFPWQAFYLAQGTQWALKLGIGAFALLHLRTGRYVYLLLTTVLYGSWAGSLFHVHDPFFHAEWNPHGSITTFLILLNVPTWIAFAGRRAGRPGAWFLSPEASASWVLAAMQVYILSMYFQAGLAKLLNSGLSWGRGEILSEAIFLIGPKWLRAAAYGPWPALLAGGSLLFELVVLPLFLASPVAFGVMGALFHLGCGLFIGLSFWFLLLLYPVVFFGEAWLVRAARRSGSSPRGAPPGTPSC